MVFKRRIQTVFQNVTNVSDQHKEKPTLEGNVRGLTESDLRRILREDYGLVPLIKEESK